MAMVRTGDGGGERIWILSADLDGYRALILQSRILASAPGLRNRSDLDPLGFRIRRFMAASEKDRDREGGFKG